LIILVHFIILVEHLIVELSIRILPVVRGLPVLLQELSQVLCHLLRVWLLILAATLAALGGFFLETLCIPQRIEGVIGRAHARADTGKHNDLTLITGHE
jgi:hypothetical protein